MRVSGGCLCGAVWFSGEGEAEFQAKCYCTDCRKLGSGHAGWIALPTASLSIEGEPQWYESTSDGGNRVGRAFCPKCGVGLFGRNEVMAGRIFVRPSTLDDPEVFAPQMSIYASRAPSWDQPASGVPAFATMPPMPEGAGR